MADKSYPLEQLFRPFFRGAAMVTTGNTPNEFAGRTTLASGSALVTVSTRQVNSDSIIQVTGQHVTAQNSGFGAGLCVRSISPGASITMGWSDGLGRGFTTTLMWEVKKTS